jgi:hypothetical protein
MIYYPHFEVESETWLKFALLFFERLMPIVPQSGYRYLSHLHSRLQDESDLIEVIEPKRTEGDLATERALRLCERILERPGLYESTFRRPGFLPEWKTPALQRYELFAAKYNAEWQRFCVERNLGRKSVEGIEVHPELGFVYMSSLAQRISEARGLPPVTDHQQFDLLSTITRVGSPSNADAVDLAHGVIRLHLPLNLAAIDLEDLFALRRNRDFRQRLRAFRTAIDEFHHGIEEAQCPEAFAKVLGTTWGDLRGSLGNLAVGFAEFSLGAWLVLSSPDAITAEYLNTVWLAGAAFLLGPVRTARDSWGAGRPRRDVRRYLATLGTLQPSVITNDWTSFLSPAGT